MHALTKFFVMMESLGDTSWKRVIKGFLPSMNSNFQSGILNIGHRIDDSVLKNPVLPFIPRKLIVSEQSQGSHRGWQS